VSADDNAPNKNYYKRLAEEMAEADQPHNRRQALLDRWWQARLDLEAELDDMYEVGGFIEYHSKTPSFHRSWRDPDWRRR
jgi:hypothetical protein